MTCLSDYLGPKTQKYSPKNFNPRSSPRTTRGINAEVHLPGADPDVGGVNTSGKQWSWLSEIQRGSCIWRDGFTHRFCSMGFFKKEHWTKYVSTWTSDLKSAGMYCSLSQPGRVGNPHCPMEQVLHLSRDLCQDTWVASHPSSHNEFSIIQFGETIWLLYVGVCLVSHTCSIQCFIPAFCALRWLGAIQGISLVL